MGFDGLRVLSLESRRSEEMATLVRKQGGEAVAAPSMREVPIEDNPEVFAFYEGLLRGEFEMVILLTGVGTRAVDKVLSTRHPEGAFAAALRGVSVVPRGPKPQAVLRDWGVDWAVSVPSPNTWREILAVTQGRPERRIAIQEFGRPSVELQEGLRARGCEVTRVTVYQWDLPEDTGPLRAAAREVAAGRIAVLLLTTSMQLPHLLRVAEEEGIADAVKSALGNIAICSIGPTTSEAVENLGFVVAMEPSSPKMGILVKEAAERTGDMIARKRN
jgi:uroporphyrinogen-III synthase